MVTLAQYNSRVSSLKIFTYACATPVFKLIIEFFRFHDRTFTFCFNTYDHIRTNQSTAGCFHCSHTHSKTCGLKQYVVSDGEVAPTLPAVPGNQTILTAPRGQEAGAEVQTEGDAGTGTDENPDAGAEADGAGDAGNGEEGAADAYEKPAPDIQ